MFEIIGAMAEFERSLSQGRPGVFFKVTGMLPRCPAMNCRRV